MAIAIVSSLCEALGQNGGTTGAINTTGANALAVCVSYYSAGPTPSITDSKSNGSYSGKTAQGPSGGAGNNRIRWWVHAAPSVGSGHTFTVTGNETYSSIAVYALSGCDASPYEEESGSSIATEIDEWPVGEIAPNGEGRIFLAAITVHNAITAASMAVDSSFTLHNPIVETSFSGGNQYGMYPAHFIDTGTTTKNPTFSWTTNREPATAMITLIPGAGGGGGIAIPVVTRQFRQRWS